jgi:hypothetical protein
MSQRGWKIVIFAIVVGGGAGVARAEDNPFGTPEDLAPCQSDRSFSRTHGWSPTTAPKSKLTKECQAEIAKRVEVCLKDPDAAKIFNDPQYRAHSDPPAYCGEIAISRMKDQAGRLAADQKKAKAEEEAKAKLAAQEVPKADLKDAKLEKAIYTAFHLAYPDAKILKVILTDRAWDYEKDAFNRVTGRDLNASIVNKRPDGSCEIFSEMWVQQGHGKSFSGPFEERGAGSLNKVGILCEKVK